MRNFIIVVFAGFIGTCLASLNDHAIMQRQTSLNNAAHQLHLAEISKFSGYTGVSLSADLQFLDIWWKGTPEEAVMDLISKVESVKTRILPAEYSKADLDEIAAPLKQLIASQNNPFFAINYPVNGTSITLQADVPSNTTQETLSKHLPGSVQKIANRRKIRMKFSRSRKPKFTGRFADYPPFEGGIAICGSKMRCTAGFAVTNAAGEKFLLTAGHCGVIGEKFYACDSPESYNFIGTAVDRIYEKDALLIKAENVVGAVWDGPLASSSSSPSCEVTRAVLGSIFPAAGAKICISGSTSGQICGFEVRGLTDLCLRDGDDLVCTFGMIQVVRPAGTITFGDSGGPAFIYAKTLSNGEERMYVVGTISSKQGTDIANISPFIDVSAIWDLKALI